jgi:hypothetical protein
MANRYSVLVISTTVRKHSLTRELKKPILHGFSIPTQLLRIRLFVNKATTQKAYLAWIFNPQHQLLRIRLFGK